MENEANEENFNPNGKCRWSSYGNYRLLLWAWMMNEYTVMFTPAEIALNGFYTHGCIQVVGTIFTSIPLVYSEICIGQYTNCNIITMWDFFPIFRCVGFGTLYLILLKTIYMLVLTSWYLEYSFFGALDPPPWFSCAEFNDSKCMVKSVNVSVFQHCMEAEYKFGDDCGMKTASNCFFEREIGGNNTKNSANCLFPWKTLVACSSVSILIFLLSLKKEKIVQFIVKLLVAYVCIVLLILFCVALSTSGTWYAKTMVPLEWRKLTLHDFSHILDRSVLSMGTGCGMIIYLTRDVPFRSPATMSAVSISLFVLMLSLLFSLIIFSGFKTMIYFHGEEPNVIEQGNSYFFLNFACVTEVMNYFDSVHLWGFAWFSSVFFCLFVNLWLLYLFWGELIHEIEIVRKYKNFASAMLIAIINMLSWPFFCSDLTAVLTDATEIIQTTNILLFSFAIYWVYGFKYHNVDIIFMIGIKASFFWKICWLMNPLILALLLYNRWGNLVVSEYGESYFIEEIQMRCDLLLLYILLSIYYAILIIGILLQIHFYYRAGELQGIFTPTEYWGPKDKILYKSRKMFLPEIMTTEFLYRQVRDRGYRKKKIIAKKPVNQTNNTTDGVEWSALTSN